MKNAMQKLEAKRAAILEQLSAVDAAIKAELKKRREAQHREALALLHKSGVLDDPARLRELLENSTAKATGDSRNEAKPTPAKPASDLPAPTGVGVATATMPGAGKAEHAQL